MNYNNIFVWLLGCWILIRIVYGEYRTTENKYVQKKINCVYALLAFLPIIYIVVFGPMQGDVPVYIYNYKNLPEKWTDIVLYIKTLDNSYLFWTISIIIKKISGANTTAFRLVIALLQSVPVIYIYRKYSDSYLLSLYLFVTSAIPIAWMMSGIRQFTAVTLIFAATSLVLKKDYKKVIIIILIATLIHQTAIIMLPIVFIAQGKAWNKKTLALIAIAIMLVYVFTSKSGAYESFMETAGVAKEVYVTDDGTNPLRVLVNFVPVILAFIGRKMVEKDDIPIINMSVNMSIISFGIYLISMVTSGIMVGRVPIYMSLYNFILLPYLIKRIFTYDSYRVILGFVIVFYGLYYYVQYV